MALNPQILTDTLPLVLARSPNLTGRFYEILFERYPAAAPLFRMDRLKAQEKMLADAIGAVVAHVEDAGWLVGTLKAMGARHLRYGVTEEMYGWVADSLLSAMAEAAGDDWTDEVRDAWTTALGAVAGLMQEGAREAQASSAAASSLAAMP